MILCLILIEMNRFGQFRLILYFFTEQKDKQACYHLGVNSYKSKQVIFESFQNTMRTTGMYC